MRNIFKFVASLVLGLVMAGCGITVQTGPEDEQRQTEVSVIRAKEIRGQYAEQLRLADPVQKAEIMKRLIDSVSAGYIRYGYRIAAEWRAAGDGRVQPMPDTEIREVVSRSNESQQPMFGAYEDIVDLAMQEIRESAQFDQQGWDRLEEFRSQFYKVRSTVFYPSENADSYERELAEMQAETERLSEELANLLETY